MGAQREDSLYDLSVESTELGTPDSFRRHVLTWVLEERYDKALEEMREFLGRESDYPNFKDKVHRYITHSIDLVYAIKAKRHFPGMSSLTRTKQQELREKFKEHFRELNQSLKKIEKIETDLRVQDVRSTIYVVKALWWSGLAILLFAFWMDIVRGLTEAASLVFNDELTKAVDWLFSFMGF